MTGSNKKASYDVPKYQEMTPQNIGNSYGSANFNNGAWNYTPGAEDSQFQNDIAATRSAILKSINGSSQDQQAALNNWQDTYFKEAQRLSQPQLEQSLFDRGLGGSQFYAGSLNDLIAKNTTNAILNKYQLAQMQDQQNLANLAGVGNYDQMLRGSGNDLLTMALNNQQNRESLNNNRYINTLPYTVSYNPAEQKNGFGKLIGTVGGGIAGAFVGNPMLGAQLGGAIGGGIDSSSGANSFGGGLIDTGLAGLGGLNFGSGGGLGSQVKAFGGGTKPMNFSPYSRASMSGLSFAR